MPPLIWAVGHEPAVTLIDFAADRRAPTPTEGAEIAVPRRGDLMERLAALGARKLTCWQRGIEQHREKLRWLSRALPALDEFLAIPRQRLAPSPARPPPRATPHAPAPT